MSYIVVSLTSMLPNEISSWSYLFSGSRYWTVADTISLMLLLFSLAAPRECFLCGHLAEYECGQCLMDHKLQPGKIKQYCSTCSTQVVKLMLKSYLCTLYSNSSVISFFHPHAFSHKHYQICLLFLQVHTHTSRRQHTPHKLTVPDHLPEDASVQRHQMQLFAVLCINTSHYVSFVKYGPDPRSWIFFDSMADRCGMSYMLNFQHIQM